MAWTRIFKISLKSTSILVAICCCTGSSWTSSVGSWIGSSFIVSTGCFSSSSTVFSSLTSSIIGGWNDKTGSSLITSCTDSTIFSWTCGLTVSTTTSFLFSSFTWLHIFNKASSKYVEESTDWP